MLKVLHQTSYEQNCFYIQGRYLTKEQGEIVMRDCGAVNLDAFYHFGEDR